MDDNAPPPYQQAAAADANGTNDNGDSTANAVPPQPDAPPTHITIAFRASSGGEVAFKMKTTTKLEKAMVCYPLLSVNEAMSTRVDGC